jgi:hypothetical protein
VCPIVFGQSLQHLGSWNLPLASVAVLYVVSGLMWWVVDPEDGLDGDAAARAVA